MSCKAARSQAGPSQGFAYLGILFLIAGTAVALTAVTEIWSTAQLRQREQELIRTGTAIRDAIGLYYQRTPGSVKRYPQSLDDLLEDRRYLSLQRYLRRIYRDPIAGDAQWGLIRAPDGGVMGVHSLSMRQARKRVMGTAPLGERYADWHFVYVPPPVAVAPPKPGATR